MQTIQVVFVLSVVTVFVGGLAFYFWRRSTSLYALLVEGANRFEELRHQAMAFEAKTKDQEAKVRDFHVKALQADKASLEAKSHAQELVKAFEDKSKELAYVTDKLERQKSYLEGLVAKQSEQIQGLESGRALLEAELAAERVDWADKIEKLRHSLDSQGTVFNDQLKTLKADFEKSQQDLKQVTKKAAEVDPVEFKKLRRKVSQYARLYITMKGLKEMAEERSHNWEVALAKLSTWIIHQKQGARATLPKELGPLVGTALKAAGQQLIHDEDDVVDAMSPPRTPPAPSDLDAAVASHLAANKPAETKPAETPEKEGSRAHEPAQADVLADVSL